MDNKKNQTATPFGCVALIIGIIAALICWIPVVGAYSMGLGIMGLTFAGFAYALSKKHAKKTRLPIIALLISGIAGSIGAVNYIKHKEVFDGISEIRSSFSRGLWGLTTKYIFEDVLNRDSSDEPTKIIQDTSTNKSSKVATSEKKEQSPVTTRTDVKAKNQVLANTKDPSKIYYFSVVDKLRMRASPTLSSEVVSHLNFGEQVELLNEKSTVKEKIVLSGEERFDYWYKVKKVGYTKTNGWVYGAAILEASEGYSKTVADGLLRTINWISKDSINKILDFPIDDNFQYSGLLTYASDENNAVYLDGRFYIKGITESIDGLYDSRPSVEYTGRYKSTKLHGEFVKEERVFEASYTTKIIFDEGNCKSYHLLYFSEGDEMVSESDNPVDCSFEYIKKGLR